MARPKLPNPTRARIVTNSADASSDKFIALRLAQELFAKGELVQIDLGPAYPHSYMRKDNFRSLSRGHLIEA